MQNIRFTLRWNLGRCTNCWRAFSLELVVFLKSPTRKKEIVWKMTVRKISRAAGSLTFHLWGLESSIGLNSLCIPSPISIFYGLKRYETEKRLAPRCSGKPKKKTREKTLWQVKAIAAAQDISMDAVFSVTDGLFKFKEEWKTALKAFLVRKDVLAWRLTGFGKSYDKQCGA